MHSHIVHVGILYDNRYLYQSKRIVAHNTRLAGKNNFDIMRANVELYSKSPYFIGNQLWNDFTKEMKDIGTKKRFRPTCP